MEEKVTVVWRVEEKVSIVWKIFKILGDGVNAETERFPKAHLYPISLVNMPPQEGLWEHPASRNGAFRECRLKRRSGNVPPQEREGFENVPPQ